MIEGAYSGRSYDAWLSTDPNEIEPCGECERCGTGVYEHELHGESDPVVCPKCWDELEEEDAHESEKKLELPVKVEDEPEPLRKMRELLEAQEERFKQSRFGGK